MKIPDNPWKKQDSKEIYDNPWITLHEDKVINPGGGISHYSTVHFKNYALGIIPIDEKDNTWLVGQWRYPLNEYSWEIPMGGGLKNINILESAKRELKEETGLKASKWTEILRIHTSNSVTDELGFVFLAEQLEHGEPEFEETEDLVIRKLPFNEVLDMAIEGAITDSISLAGIFKLARVRNI